MKVHRLADNMSTRKYVHVKLTSMLTVDFLLETDRSIFAGLDRARNCQGYTIKQGQQPDGSMPCRIIHT
jgi:hypothetical protein